MFKLDRFIFAIFVAFTQINSVFATNQKTMDHRHIGKIVFCQNFVCSCNDFFGHGIYADVLYYRKVQFCGKRGNNSVFGRAGSLIFFKKYHQVISVCVVTVRQTMDISTGIDETLDS